MTSQTPSEPQSGSPTRSKPGDLSDGPDLGRYSEPFWDAAGEHRFVFQWDAKAGKAQFYPRPISMYSGRRDLVWKTSKGFGTVVAATVVSLRTSDPPYQLVIVDMDEGFRVLGRTVDSMVGQAPIGTRVRLAWRMNAQGREERFVFQPSAAPQ